MNLTTKTLGKMSRGSNTCDYFHFKTIWDIQQFVRLVQVENVAILLPDITRLFPDLVGITTRKTSCSPSSTPVSKSPCII